MTTEKYNFDGEWRPIQYKGNVDQITQEIKNTTDNEKIQGCLFYIRTTGYNVIEFIIKGSLYLPAKEINLANGIHLIPCFESGETEIRGNTFIYDGWISVANDKPETIQSALETINYTANLLSFIFECDVKWILKYRIYDHRSGSSLPTDKHIELLQNLSKTLFDVGARKYLEAALDWYTHGQNANSLFNRYLSYWIAMEGLAISLYNGKLGDLFEIEKEERNISMINSCIDQLFTKYFSEDKKKFIERAYFDCVKTLTYQTQQGLTAVFGEERDVVTKIYKPLKGEKYSLEDIRHKVAHGEFVEWEFRDEEIVRKKLYRLMKITQEFILRILTGIKPEDKLPNLDKEIFFSLSMYSPNSTMVVSDLKVLPSKDWGIRPEWIDEV